MKDRRLALPGVLAASVLVVPLLSVALVKLPFVQAENLRFVLAGILYTGILLFAMVYLKKKSRIEKWDIAVCLIAFIFTLAYTVPLSVIGILAAATTALATLVLFQLKRSGATDLIWAQASAAKNVWLFAGITLFYVLLSSVLYGYRISLPPNWFRIIQALAPAVSEEIIFRGLFSAGLILQLRLKDDFLSNAWVFLVITVPFAFLHMPELFLFRSVGMILARSWPILMNTLLDYILMKKYGLVYAIYAHALSDYLAFQVK